MLNWAYALKQEISSLFALHSSLLRKRQGNPGIDTQKDDEQCLHRVDDEYEEEGIVLLDAVENEHSLHGKVPRTCSVGSRYDDCDAAHYEGYQSTHQTEMRCRLKALEREIIVEEVTQPDAQREGYIERYVLHALQRDDALPQSAQRSFHLIIYSEFLQQEVQQDEYGDAADYRYEIARGGEFSQDAVHAGTRLVKEVQEYWYLHQKHHSGDEKYQQRVDGSLRNHRSQSFREGYAVISFQHGTSCKFSRSWDDETQCI